MGADKHSGILMSLPLLVAETINLIHSNIYTESFSCRLVGLETNKMYVILGVHAKKLKILAKAFHGLWVKFISKCKQQSKNQLK